MFTIISAIENRQVLKFKYKKETTYRKVDVYVLGLNASGETLIRAYEINTGWKLFKVAQMNDTALSSEKVYGHKIGYSSLPDKAFKKVIKKVK